MGSEVIHQFYKRTVEILWVITLIGLPMTSMPLIWTYLGAIVAPFSALPILVLLIIWLIPFILRRGALPVENQSAVFFILMLILASAATLFLVETPTFRDKTATNEMLSAFATLGMGSVFYFIFASLPVQVGSIKRTLRWINVGGIILLAWTIIQVYYVAVKPELFPDFFFRIQDLLVTRSPFSFVEGSYRVSGLSYEASWFAHQLNILYFPLWISATYLGYSSFGFRIWRLSVENLLLVFGAVLFYFSSPRVGLIAFLLMVVFIFVKFNVKLYRILFKRISNSNAVQKLELSGALSMIRFFTGLGSALILLLIYAGLIILVLYLGSQRDWRLALLFSRPPNWDEIIGLLRLDERIVVWMGYRFAFLERTVYWVTGWRIFNEFPLLGVGLGNAGFFFPLKVPSLGWASVEIRNILLRLPYLPNIKSLWVRLLAESGLVGFSTFVGWLYVLWRSTGVTIKSPQSDMKSLALAGQLSLIAFIVEGFSIDSFAMPYLWVMAGLISAAGMMYRRRVWQQAESRLVNKDDPGIEKIESAESVRG